MFDPFGDYEIAGYLRNTNAEKYLTVVKAAEHALFRAQLPAALTYLAQCRRIGYDDFLNVHRLHVASVSCTRIRSLSNRR